MREQWQVVLHEHVVEQHEDLRLKEDHKILALDELSVQIVGPLYADLLAQFLYGVQLNRVDTVCRLQCHRYELINLLDELVYKLHPTYLHNRWN